MHSWVGVRQLVIEIFINIPSRVSKIVLDVIDIHHVVVNEATSVLLLRLEVESHVVPVGWPDFVVGVKHVLEIIWQWQWQRFSIKQSHLTLEVLVFASVILTNITTWDLQLRICCGHRSLLSSSVGRDVK